MAIIGTPIDNGDGSYTFQQDSGEPLVLRGDEAKRAYDQSAGAPPAATPPSLDPSIVDAAQAGPDQRTADLPGLKDFGGSGSLGPVSKGGMGGYQTAADLGQTQGGPPPSASDATGYFDTQAAASGGRPPPVATPLPKARDLGDVDSPEFSGKKSAPQGTQGAVFYRPPQAQPIGGSGQGGTYVPGGWQPHSRSEKGTTPLSDEEAVDRKKALQGIYEAGAAQGDVQGARGLEEAQVHDQAVGELQASEQRQRQIEQDRQARVNEKLAKIDKMADAAANEKIDPSHFWADKSDAYKFEAALFTGLSVFGSGIGGQGQKAYAQETINNLIDKDIDAQKANLANAHNALQAQTNLLGQYRQEFGDEQGAELAFRATKTATAVAKLNEIAARTTDPEQKAKAQQLAADLQMRYTDYTQQLNRKELSRTDAYRPGGVAGGKGEIQADNSQVMSIGGKHYAFDNKHAAEEAKDNVPRLERGIAGLQRIADLGRNPDSQVPGTEAFHELKIALNNISQEVPALNTGSNKLSETAVAHDQSVLGSPEDWIKLTTEGKATAIRKMAGEFQQVKRGHMQGAKVAKPYAVPGAKGAMPQYGFVIDQEAQNPYDQSLPNVKPAGTE